MCSRSTSWLQITWRSKKLYYTDCASLSRSESSTSYAVEIPTWWHSKWPEPGRPRIPSWRPTETKLIRLAKCFLGYEVKYIPRDDNAAADMLSKLGSGRKPIPPGVFLEH